MTQSVEMYARVRTLLTASATASAPTAAGRATAADNGVTDLDGRTAADEDGVRDVEAVGA